MKRIKSVFSFALVMLILLPVYVNASGSFKYEDAVIYAEQYINKGNYKTTHDKYIKKTNIPHFIEKNEYEKTIGQNNRSYLFDGVEFWTSTGNDSKHFIVNHKGETKEMNNNSKHNIKDTEYVNEDVKVRGNGTYHNPWTFDPMYEVTVTTDEKYGHIIDGTEFISTKTVYVSRGEEVIMQVEKKAGTGYKYITNSCGATYSNGYLKISNVKRNISCNVIFGIGKFKVTLNGANPNIIVSSFKDNFYLYNDSLNSRTIITKITPPQRTGYIFKGYKYNDIVVVNPDGTLNRQATNEIYEDIELDPLYDISAPADVIVSGGETKIYNSSDTTLTCSTTTKYDDNTKLYYSFGYSTSDGVAPSTTSWTTPGLSNKLEINKSLYFGSRYYSCKIYAHDSETLENSLTTTSPTSSNALVKFINAKITFDANGGTISGPSNRYTRHGKTVLFSGENIIETAADALPSAKKTGYVFTGWYNKADGGKLVLKTDCSLSGTAVSEITDTSEYILTENKTLYAHYKTNNYSLSYNLSSGTYGTYHPTSVAYDEEFTVSNPTKSATATFKIGSGITCKDGSKSCSDGYKKVTNYTFDGWNITNMDNVMHYYGIKSTSKNTLSGIKDTKFKNLRSTSGTVSFDAGWTGNTLTLPTISKSGYECVWTSSGLSDRPGTNGKWTPSTATERTFTAKCTQNKIYISFNCDGYGKAPSPIEVEYNKKVSGFPTAQCSGSKSGYVQYGWHESNSTSIWVPSNTNGWPYNRAKSITLYPNWSENMELCYGLNGLKTAVYWDSKDTTGFGDIRPGEGKVQSIHYIGEINEFAEVLIILQDYCTGLHAHYKTAGKGYAALRGCNPEDVTKPETGFELFTGISEPAYIGYINKACIRKSSDATAAWKTNCKNSSHKDYCNPY